MRFLLVTACTALAAIVLATGRTASAEEKEQEKKTVTAVPPAADVIQTGKTLGPLSPDEVNYSPVTVPEPVWASVLAGCAVIILRRGRR